jgi:plastocyanin
MKAILLVFALFLGSALCQMTYEVTGSDFKFEPANLNISTGDSVHWKWTVASLSFSFLCVLFCF